MSGFYVTVARYYDAEHQDKTDDLDMYTELAAEYDGPIFEVGCGTGRVLLHLARAGNEVDGIDLEAAMLDRARRKLEAQPLPNARLIQGDVLKYKAERQYNLVLLSYNALMHFHGQAQQIELLRRLRALVSNEGLLVIDLPNPADSFAAQDSDAMIFEKSFIEPESGHLVMQSSISQLDRTEQMLHTQWIYDEISSDGTVRRTLAPVDFRYFFYSELRLLLQLTGFSVMAAHGSPELDVYEDGCERLIVFARPVGQ
ncbi:MAG: class I SAM-dependent methyltransferase [Anaerolineae bacterium]|nr:class I SAM-dependent methyltransferase [Anaerolineae bacterium]